MTPDRADEADIETGYARRGRRKALASRPELYLVYVLFYAFPWLFEAPSLLDLAVGFIAVACLIPIYLHGFEGNSRKYILNAVAMEALAFATAPFHGMNGTFHIFASAQAGFQIPRRNAIVLLSVLALAYLATSLFMGLYWTEYAIVLFLGAVTGLSCMAGAEQLEIQSVMERSRLLDKELAAADERERIARDLHDLLGRTLTAVTLKSEVARKLMATNPARADQELQDIQEAAREALRDVRQVVSDLHLATVEKELERARDVLKAADIAFTVKGTPPEGLTVRQNNTIGLAIREAVTNIIRHANATSASLEFTGDAAALGFVIADNGCGGPLSEGAGLTGLRKRLSDIGGTVRIESVGGTRLMLSVPHPSSKVTAQ